LNPGVLPCFNATENFSQAAKFDRKLFKFSPTGNGDANFLKVGGLVFFYPHRNGELTLSGENPGDAKFARIHHDSGRNVTVEKTIEIRYSKNVNQTPKKTQMDDLWN